MQASVDGVTSTVPAVAAPQVCSTVVGDEDDLVDLWYSTDYSLEAEGRLGEVHINSGHSVGIAEFCFT